MRQILLVFFGGGLGSISRYLISRFISNHLEQLPIGTFLVNILGCFLIGLIIGGIERYHLPIDIGFLLATGFCGGFTTFSSFAYESTILMRNQHYWTAVSYTLLSTVIGLMAVFLGMAIIKRG